jgi:hypothetical protein
MPVLIEAEIRHGGKVGTGLAPTPAPHAGVQAAPTQSEAKRHGADGLSTHNAARPSGRLWLRGAQGYSRQGLPSQPERTIQLRRSVDRRR